MKLQELIIEQTEKQGYQKTCFMTEFVSCLTILRC